LFGFFKKKPDSLIGEIFDKRYQITKLLGQGGFGDTYFGDQYAIANTTAAGGETLVAPKYSAS